MSFRALDWAYEQNSLSSGEKSVLVALAWHKNEKTRLCCPSVETLAADTALGASTVRRHLNSLADKGLIEKNCRFGGVKGRRSNQYVFTHLEPSAQTERLIGDSNTINRPNSNDQPPKFERSTAQFGTHKESNSNKQELGEPPGASKGAGGEGMTADEKFTHALAENQATAEASK